MECQPTSSRVKVEDLITDEEEQSAASTLETTKSERSFWDRPVGLPNMQWAYDLCMPPEWNEVVASMVVKNQVALLQPTGEVYRQPMADEISEPSNIFVDGVSLKAKSVSWSTTSTVSQPPVWLKMEDTGEAHLHVLRERFEPAPLLDQEVIHKDVTKARYRLKIDLTDAYKQVHIHIKNIPKTVFASLMRTFVSNIMQIGDCNVPATFQRLMTSIF
ncbi:hypothetical protein C0995_011184 [Termitomyces sp. Mi166|nr:hypothetical protein C0995_012248 [Termitomyces sp. Mi166\